MYREMAGTDERVRAIPGVRDRRVRATKVRLYENLCKLQKSFLLGFFELDIFKNPHFRLNNIADKQCSI